MLTKTRVLWYSVVSHLSYSWCPFTWIFTSCYEVRVLGLEVCKQYQDLVHLKKLLRTPYLFISGELWEWTNCGQGNESAHESLEWHKANQRATSNSIGCYTHFAFILNAYFSDSLMDESHYVLKEAEKTACRKWVTSMEFPVFLLQGYH